MAHDALTFVDASQTTSEVLKKVKDADGFRLPTAPAGLPTALGAAAMAASTSVTIATDDARIGPVNETAPATDTASSGLNGRLQRIAQRITSLIALLPTALGASGGLKTDGAGYSSSVSITRTNDTNAYTANDVIGAATGSTQVQTFANIGPSGGGEVIITTVQLEIDITAVVSGMTSFNLHFYSATAPSAYGDNAAWDLGAGDRATYITTISLGTPADIGSTLMITTDNVNRQITVPSGGSLYAYLVTVGAWTPAASSVFKITLKSVGV